MSPDIFRGRCKVFSTSLQQRGLDDSVLRDLTALEKCVADSLNGLSNHDQLTNCKSVNDPTITVFCYIRAAEKTAVLVDVKAPTYFPPRVHSQQNCRTLWKQHKMKRYAILIRKWNNLHVKYGTYIVCSETLAIGQLLTVGMFLNFLFFFYKSTGNNTKMRPILAPNPCSSQTIIKHPRNIGLNGVGENLISIGLMEWALFRVILYWQVEYTVSFLKRVNPVLDRIARRRFFYATIKWITITHQQHVK